VVTIRLRIGAGRSNLDVGGPVARAAAVGRQDGDLRELLDVRLGAGRRLAVDEVLGRTAAERDLDLRDQLAALVVENAGISVSKRVVAFEPW
jgi:hypothetical protein